MRGILDRRVYYCKKIKFCSNSCIYVIGGIQYVELILFIMQVVIIDDWWKLQQGFFQIIFIV